MEGLSLALKAEFLSPSFLLGKQGLPVSKAVHSKVKGQSKGQPRAWAVVAITRTSTLPLPHPELGSHTSAHFTPTVVLRRKYGGRPHPMRRWRQRSRVMFLTSRSS